MTGTLEALYTSSTRGYNPSRTLANSKVLHDHLRDGHFDVDMGSRS